MHTLADIAKLLGLPAPTADAAMTITGLSTLAEAGPGDLAVVGSDAYVKRTASSKAGALLVQKRVKAPEGGFGRPVLAVDDADLAMAKVIELYAPSIPRPASGVHPDAHVAKSATIGEGAAIAPHAYVGERTVIGARTVIHPGVYIGDDVVIGDDCQLFPNAVVRERIRVGHRVTINAGSVLGTDGFGYRWDGTKHAKIPQIGTVIIEDDVEIGSCVCVDRAKFGATKVGRGTKLDNLVQVGHNARLGPHCIMVGQSGVAGSVTLGAGVVIGGQTAIRDHVSMGDGAMAAACSGVADDVEPKQIVSGVPALPHRQALREQAALRRLPNLVVQMRKMQEEIEALKKQLK